MKSRRFCAWFSVLLMTSLGGCFAEREADEETEATEEAFSSGPIDQLSAEEWAEIRARCSPTPESEPALGFSDYRWGYSLEEMGERYRELYVSPKRLPEHAYFDPAETRIIMHVPASWGRRVVVSPRLVKSVRRHIEKALAVGYVDHVFFPDMGHAHFFVPKERWDARYGGRPVSQIAEMYTRLFADPELRVLYHTAEQLTVMDDAGLLLPDRKLKWRFFTRNIIGDNRAKGTLEVHHAPETSANTLGSLEGHHYYGGGFHVSAHERGCFPFTHQGQTFYFDLNLAGLGP